MDYILKLKSSLIAPVLVLSGSAGKASEMASLGLQ